MNLFYLEDGSGCKSQTKLSKTLPKIHPVLLSNPENPIPTFKNSLKYSFKETCNLREFIPEKPELSQEIQEKIIEKNNLKRKLLEFCEKLKNYQGENDEILSRLHEQKEKLKNLSKIVEDLRVETKNEEFLLKSEIEKEESSKKSLNRQESLQEYKKNSLKAMNQSLSNDLLEITRSQDQLSLKTTKINNLTSKYHQKISNTSESLLQKQSKISEKVAISSELHNFLKIDDTSISNLKKSIKLYNSSKNSLKSS
jgi:chromosome segregation ATPase